MRSLAVALVALAAVSCKRPLGASGADAGTDAGAPSVGLDGGPIRIDAAPEDALRIDVAIDRATADAAPTMCPAAAEPLDVCNCCCGPPIGRACYYPSLGESRDMIPNPMPTQEDCARFGCSAGVRHVCCADPGPEARPARICAHDTSEEDAPSYAITKHEGNVCTTLQMGALGVTTPIVGLGADRATGWRAPCADAAAPRTYAIGGIGSVTPVGSGLPFRRVNVHVVLFFDSGTGIADAARIDVDDIAVAPQCTGDVCRSCDPVCAFDATYSYGREGGRRDWRHTAVLSPPASFTHVRSPLTTMPADMACAPPLPACGSAALDAGDAMAALRDPDVTAALERSKLAGTIPLYGVDPRLYDGQVFQLTRSSDGGGGAFLVGAPCPPGSGTSCMQIPGGLTRMVEVLEALDGQQLADPSCMYVRP